MKTTIILFASILVFCLASCNMIPSTKEVNSLETEVWWIDSVLNATVNQVSSVQSRQTDIEEEQAILNARVDKLDIISTQALNISLSNDTAIRKLDENYLKLANAVWLRGRQNNDLLKFVFNLAYQGDSATIAEGEKSYKQYAYNCGNKEIFDSMIKRLTPAQMQKIIQVDDLDKRIAVLEQRTITK